MKRLFFAQILTRAIVFIALALLSAAESTGKEVFPMEYESIVIWYISPEILTYVPVTKVDIEERSLSKIIIGNKREIEKITRVLIRIKGKAGDSEGITGSLTFKIKIKYIDKTEEIWFGDKKQNFEIEGGKHRGKIPKKYFKELISLFDAHSEVVDFKYLENFQQ